MRIYQRMPGFEGVNAGGTATAKLPIGRQFHFLDLVYTGVTLAQMTEIRVLANGKPIHRYTATERDAMNQFLGLEGAGTPGILRIPFDRLMLRIKEGEMESALNTGNRDGDGRAINSLTLEVDIAGAATNPAFTLYAEQSEGRRDAGPGTILHVQRHTRNAAGSGEFEISDLPYGGATTMALVRTTFVTPNDRIDKIKVERGLYTIFERTTAVNEFAQKNGGGDRVPQAGYWVVDTTERGYAGEPIQVAGFSDFRYILTMSAAEDMPVLQETLGGLGD